MKPIAPIALGFLLSACASTPPVTAQETAPSDPEDGDRTIRVSAQAVASRAPDRAYVRFAVETVARTAREAMSRNGELMNAVLSRLAELGVPRDRIQTQSIALQPRFQREPGAEPEITGYTASNQVHVPVADIDRLGAIIDGGVAAGANRVLGIEFEIADPEAAYHEALERAIGMAEREARVIASAMGETLGPALRVSTGGLSMPGGRQERAQFMAQAESTPVQPGELDVSAWVQIVYRIGR